MLQNKIDFLVVLSVNRANPNGDPLNGNRPREDYEGFGEISDVCIKRKVRNRLQDLGENIFVQMAERSDDGYGSLSERAKGELRGIKDKAEYEKAACEKWIDVRAFGQVFAFKAVKGEKDDIGSVSVGVRGPVSLHPAFSIDPIDIATLQITKSVNSEPTKDGSKSSDTMGQKHRVEFGLYTFKGSINCQLAEKTGFSDEDAELIHSAIKSLFENDASAARPDGSMTIHQVYWWKHDSKLGQYPSYQVHNQVKLNTKAGVEVPKSIQDYEIQFEPLEGLALDLYEVI